jgi:cysteinyl-tRNA synthetase
LKADEIKKLLSERAEAGRRRALATTDEIRDKLDQFEVETSAIPDRKVWTARTAASDSSRRGRP